MPKKIGIIVYNMTNTSKRKCKCPSGDGSWLRHWELATGCLRPAKCIVKGCRRYTEVGAHVKDVTHKVTPWIAPFCQHHNKRPIGTLLQLKPNFDIAAAAGHDCDQ